MRIRIQYGIEQISEFVFFFGVIQQVGNVAGLHFTGVTAGRYFTYNISEVFRVAVLNVSAEHLSGETSGIAHAVIVVF